jgi:putative tricarboxylic transport membrane protein
LLAPALDALQNEVANEMQKGESANDGRTLATNRTMEIVVALVLLGGAAIVIYDSARIGFGWREGEGPAPGYYPFWVAVILGVSSLVNLVSALRGHGAGEVFVSLRPFGRVLAVLIPSVIFVALIGYIGIYIASGIFICAFMIMLGRQNPLKAIGVGAIVPVVLFLMFEKWFLVPLPKGPFEAWLGY